MSNFTNIDTIRLGWAIEGVTIPPKELMNILSFKKLKHLDIALHGLSEDHLKVIAQLDGVTDLVVEFPSVLMIGDDKLQKNMWTPVDLGDGTVKHIAKLKSLEDLIIRHAPESRDGKVAFSEQALLTLLKMPKVESLIIHPSNFTKDGLKAVNKLKLPAFVKIR